MSKKRRVFTAKFKRKVAREALTERWTLSEFAEKYELHPHQIEPISVEMALFKQ